MEMERTQSAVGPAKRIRRTYSTEFKTRVVQASEARGASVAGEDHAILAARHALYTQARERNPARWSGETRNWSPVGAVTLNPERDSDVKTHPEHIDKQQLAA